VLNVSSAPLSTPGTGELKKLVRWPVCSDVGGVLLSMLPDGLRAFR
jgi:hypothetical protein